MWLTRLARATLRILIPALGLALITGAFCLWQWNRPVALPTPSGPFSVGRTHHEWRDFSREDPLSPAPHQTRQLAIWLWYPSEKGPLLGHPLSPYLPSNWALPLQQRRGICTKDSRPSGAMPATALLFRQPNEHIRSSYFPLALECSRRITQLLRKSSLATVT